MKSSTVPQLPKHKELLSSLSPYHAKLVGESYLGRKRPVYECTDVQVFSYFLSFCHCLLIIFAWIILHWLTAWILKSMNLNEEGFLPFK